MQSFIRHVKLLDTCIIELVPFVVLTHCASKEKGDDQVIGTVKVLIADAKLKVKINTF